MAASDRASSVILSRLETWAKDATLSPAEQRFLRLAVIPAPTIPEQWLRDMRRGSYFVKYSQAGKPAKRFSPVGHHCSAWRKALLGRRC